MGRAISNKHNITPNIHLSLNNEPSRKHLMEMKIGHKIIIQKSDFMCISQIRVAGGFERIHLQIDTVKVFGIKLFKLQSIHSVFIPIEEVLKDKREE